MSVPAGVTVLDELGRGANAVTYRVRRDGRDWAMKVYARQVGRAALLALRREAALLTWVDHPGLPKVHEVGEVDDRPYMIMDLVAGRPLAEVLGGGRLDVPAAVRLARAVAEALAAVHRVGLVHRDVKPQNIMIEPDGRARLIDFGMATRADRAPGEGVAGTLLYAAPEQSGMIKRPVDGRADLYALGAVLFQCLTGAPPFVADDAGELLRMHATTPAPPLAEACPDAPASLAAIVATLLAKDPDDRYQSASLLLADLGAGTSEDAGTGEDRADTLPLIGRDEPWKALRAAWDLAKAGAGRATLITGGAGAGKTRIADELAILVRDEGRAVLHARCTAGAAPLAALRDAVEHHLAHVQDPEPVRAAAEGTHAGRLSPVLEAMLSAADPPDDEPAALGLSVATFLAGIARTAGGALLCLDDVDLADAASLATLRQLAGLLADTPLLIVGTATSPVAAFGGWAEPLALGPLDSAAVARLVTACARGLPAGDALVQRLVARGGVTPFEVIEYVRAVVDAGLLAPAWGSWELDTDGLDDVTLPADVFELMLARLDGLAPDSRHLLTVAAAIGQTFPPDLAAAASGLDNPAHCAAVLEEAVTRHVLERRGDRLAFVHGGLGAALLAALDDARRRDLHHTVASTMDDSPEEVHALARQYLQGHPDRTPDRAARACLDAGRLALSRYAPADAAEFLETAHRLRPDLPDVEELLGTALYQAGRLADAERVLTGALAGQPTGLDRARVLSRIAEIQQATGDLETSTATVRRALTELRRPLPTRALPLLLSTLLSLVAGLFVERFQLTTRDQHRQAVHRLRARLYNAAAINAILQLDSFATVVLTLRSLYPASRLGVCAEYARTRSDMSSLLRALRLPYRRSAALAKRAAAEVGEPGVVGHLAWIDRALPQVLGQGDLRRLVPDMLDRTHVIDTSNYLKMLEGGLFLLLDAGYADEAQALQAEGAQRVAEADLADHPVLVWGVASAAALGRVAEADALQRQVLEQRPAFTNLGDQQTRLHASVRSAVEQRDFAALDRAAAGVAALGIKPMTMPLYRRGIFAAIAYGRIEACLAAPPEGRALDAVDRAVRDLRGAVSGGRTLRAHLLIARAYTKHLRGDHDGALDALAAADPKLRAAGAPLVTYEATRLRARALRALGRADEAAAHASTAVVVAEQHHWPHRAQWIRTEFALDSGALSGATRTRVASSVASVNTDRHRLVDRQRLAAVEQLSLVASRILDPTELTRVALDEIIKLLGAERAYLFLLDDAGELVPRQGRDAAGTDLTSLTRYGSTLVERVRHSREALVVTGTDEGLALGSQSALVHGLRSILVAPLLFDGRLLGVVYLDSRVAKGMFTAADAGLLAALTTHVAAALETARAAELAVAVRAARRERDIAETLREAVTQLSGTLDPADVLRRLHSTLRRFLPAGPSWIGTVEDDKLQRWDEDGAVDSIAASTVADLLNAPGPITGAGTDGRPCLTIPLRIRQETVGLAVLTARDPAGFSADQLELAGALAVQGMTAYDNARLFAEVDRLATTDGLTGLLNRRQFFSLAVREVSLARRRSGPLAAIMLDIDHFKQINDRHGHPVGDQVIAAVAQRLAASVRGTDLLGRYGGEEFAILLPDTDGAGSTILAERLLAAVRDRPIETDAGPVPVTASLGVAGLDAADTGIGDLLGRADQALYDAKQNGRNRLTVV